MIRVGVVGATGRMGAEVCRAVDDGSDLSLVAAISRSRAGERLEDVLGLPGCPVVASDRLDALVEASADVAVDFTGAEHAPQHIAWCIQQGIHVVVGTTGFPLDEAWGRQDAVGVLVAPNFAIGAVLMMRFAGEAAASMPDAEIIELHHAQKRDAPSGTALLTARAIAEARGVDGGDVPIHSIRLPGLVAHQEVLFGAQGQTLSIRHDTTDRSAFMPGVLLAIRNVGRRPGLTVGLDPLLEGA